MCHRRLRNSRQSTQSSSSPRHTLIRPRPIGVLVKTEPDFLAVPDGDTLRIVLKSIARTSRPPGLRQHPHVEVPKASFRTILRSTKLCSQHAQKRHHLPHLGVCTFRQSTLTSSECAVSFPRQKAVDQHLHLHLPPSFIFCSSRGAHRSNELLD
jgi:hypothetical protein